MVMMPLETNTGTQSGFAVKCESTQATSPATSTRCFSGVSKLRIEDTIPAFSISSATTCSPRARLDKANAADYTTVETGD